MKRFWVCLTVSILTFITSGISHGDINDGLVAYYPFNGNANDESGNGNDGTVYGATLTEDRFGNTGRAYSFDGVDDFIEISPQSVVSSIGDFTISVWTFLIDWKELSQYRQYVFDGHSHSKTVTTDFYRPGFWLAYDVSKDFQTICDGILYNPPKDISQHYVDFELKGEWHHHLFMRNSTSNYIFIDGRLIFHQDTGRSDSLNIQHNWFIGTFSGNNPNYVLSGYNFYGVIDDVRIYNRALSESEIQILYNGCILTPRKHDFGIIPIDCTPSQLFTLENANEKNLQVSPLQVEGAGPTDLQIYDDTCSGTTLEPAETCTFEVSLEPTSYGSKDAQLTISFTDTSIFPIVVPLTGSVTEICECDLNQDHSCNIQDYQVFIQKWGATDCNQPGVECPCDLNNDGKCNILDYQLFIQDWGRKDCPICPAGAEGFSVQ